MKTMYERIIRNLCDADLNFYLRGQVTVEELGKMNDFIERTV